MTVLPHDPEQQKQLFIGVLPFVLLLAYWQFYHGRSSAAIAAQQTRLERLETANTAARALAMKGGPELDGKLAFYRQRMALLERLIPTTEQVPQLLHDVTVRAQRTGVDLTLVRPQPAPSAQPLSYYTLQTYELSVRGTYHDIGRFLTAIGSLPRIVISVDLQLRRSGGTAGGARVSAGGTARDAGARADGVVGGGRDRGGEGATSGERDGVALDARLRIQTYVLPPAERREAMRPKTAAPDTMSDVRAGAAAPDTMSDVRAGAAAPEAAPDTRTRSAAPEEAPDTRTRSAAPEEAPDTHTGSTAPQAIPDTRTGPAAPDTPTRSAAPETMPDVRAGAAAPEATPDTRTSPADRGTRPHARI